VAPLRDGLPRLGRYLDSAGLIRTLDRVIRLRDFVGTRLAYDDFSSLLCRRSNFWRIRHGADIDASGAIPVQAPRCFHVGSYRCDVQAATPDGLDRRVRVLYGVFCGFLWSEPVRTICVFEPVFRPLLVGFLDHVHLQRDYAAAYVGSRVPQKLGDRLLRVDVRERGHVVRALRDICYLAAPGFFAVRVAYVLPYLGGRVHFHWNTRNLPDPLFVIYPLPSNGRDVGGQECASRVRSSLSSADWRRGRTC